MRYICLICQATIEKEAWVDFLRKVLPWCRLCRIAEELKLPMLSANRAADLKDEMKELTSKREKMAYNIVITQNKGTIQHRLQNIAAFCEVLPTANKRFVFWTMGPDTEVPRVLYTKTSEVVFLEEKELISGIYQYEFTTKSGSKYVVRAVSCINKSAKEAIKNCDELKNN